MTVFIQSLCHHHRLTDGKTELSCCFLLQGRCGERWCRGTLQRLLLYAFYSELCPLTLFKEGKCLLVRAEALVQISLHLLTIYDECGSNPVVRLSVECLYLALALHYQSYGYTLYPASRQLRLHLAPQYR